MEKAIQELKKIDADVHVLSGVDALLGWDQETYMPPEGLETRGEQLAMIEGLAHDRLTDPAVPGLLAELGSTDSNPMGDASLSEEHRRYLRCFRRAWARAAKLPGDFVRERARAVSASQAAWIEARATDDFPAFEPHLAKMVDFAKREAACLDPAAKPYDVLLDQYEPGIDQAKLAELFSELKAGLSALLDKIRSRPQVDDSALKRPCPPGKQETFSRRAMALLSFDSGSGRLDLSAHPFTTTIGHGDVRITTRYHERNFASSIMSTVHETGHALYELGLPERWKRSCLGDAVSMAVHESQSRFWENLVGRGLPFWKGQFGALKADIAPVIDDLGLTDFYRALNKVEPSLIRVDADEVTYSLHVILRFELEAALVSGSLSTRDVPGAWNEAMRSLLGVVPPDNASGCLQDIHWSMGSLGYFPSYALGNLYSAQFAQAMRKELGDIDGDFARGEFGRALGWLRLNLHDRGSSLTPTELVLDLTGASLSVRPFLSYLEGKYAGIYGF
jgi:carboxypeptidase Taq